MSYEYHARRLIAKHCEAHSDGRTTHPICWNVKMNKYIGFDEVFKRMAKDYYHGMNDALVCVPNVMKLRNDWETLLGNYDSLILESMRELFNPKYSDVMRFCQPKVYKRFSLPTIEQPLWDVQYEFVGRSSGWLALTEFEGVQMRHIDEELYGSDGHSNRWWQKLCCMLAEITLMVDNRYDEYVYQAAWHLHQYVTGEQEWSS